VKLPQISLLSIAIASAITTSAPVLAAENAPALDEIVVTAQKRAQNLQEVPISVDTINGEKLEDAGITSIAGISDYIPGFNMNQTGIGTNIAIRGISSGVNQGFEQSAAQFVDGIHYGRAQLARAPFLDIERIEVLRGPQSILFGKNSTAGAISITTAKPGDDFEGSLTALYEPEYGEQDARLVLSGPISETVGGRMAILTRTTDGYIENTTLGRDEAAEKDRVVRVTLSWEPTDAWDITLKLEDGSFDADGRNIEAVHPISKLANNPNPYATVLSYLTTGYQLDTTLDGKRQSNGDYSYNDTENVTLSVEHDIGDLTLTSITGYNAYTYQELCDCDFTGSPIFNILSDEDYQQVSQELRLASSEKQTVSWIAGLFYQGSDLDFHDNVHVPSNSVVIGTAISPALLGASTMRDFTQETSLYAAFAQATWNINDRNRLLLGGRYTQETKDARRHQYHVTPGGTVLPIGTTTSPYNLLWKTFKIDPHDIPGEYDEPSFTPQIIYQFDLTKANRIYASYTTGFKSGGFDVRSNSAPTELGGIFTGDDTNGTWEFKDEKVKNYEIGGKFLLADGSLEVNAALFRSEFTDMQTSQFDGGISFIVTNAGEAVVKGLEIDSRWAITNDLLMRGGAALIDFTYTKFENGPCSFNQTPNASNFCDHSGKTREFVPELQGNVGWDYSIHFSNGLKLVNTLDVIYSDKYFTTPDLEPEMEQSSYVKLNARIGLSGSDDKWELALIGKNLTDETVVTYANGLPLATILTRSTTYPRGAGTAFYSFYNAPRTVALQGTLRF
jgi:iron complex outermembrane recepter protein